MLVKIGDIKSPEELKERLEAAAKEKPETTMDLNLAREYLKIKPKKCNVTTREKELRFDDLVKCDFADKDFIVFTKDDGTTRALRRDDIKEIYIY